MPIRRPLVVVLALFTWLATSADSFADQRVIVKTSKPYDAVKQTIADLGGTVTYEFTHANGLVAVVPDAGLDALEKTLGVQYVVRDAVIPNPTPRQVVSLAADAVDIEPAAIPSNYHSYNSQLTNVLPLQLAGFQGQGVIVGVIDSGVSRTATALCSTAPCTAASTRVVGGESFVPGETDATASTNNAHGTWVATMIGANRAFGFARTSILARAVRAYCTPASTLPCSFPSSPTVDGIWMIGQAPQARFYALKVFPASGAGAPASRILIAMERAIELKTTTMPEMRVVNMSLGGTTLNAGGDLEDELAASMAAAGISLVVSAGNTGPSGSTVGSPGTAHNILTVGAASSPVHERILREVQFAAQVGFGVGPLYRPDSNHQIADFSGRGPNADGRIDPDVVANGLASFAQGANGAIGLVSGTSFSGPTVAGVVAALYSYKPAATPDQIRAAIVGSARPDIVPTAAANDQGAGYVNAAGARDLLDTGTAAISDIGPGKKSVAQNVHIGAGIKPIDASLYSETLPQLRPGERRELYYVVKPHTAAVRLTISGVTPELPEDEQNFFFGDDLLVAVHTAKTSSIGDTGDYLVKQFVNGDKTYVLANPETGLMRITILGDSTNAGRISANVLVEEIKAALPAAEFHGAVVEGESQTHEIAIPAGTESVSFRLSWDNDWGAFPTNDLDLILKSPTGTFHVGGATLNSPETTTLTKPVAGTWTIYVDGYSVAGKNDKYRVRIDYE